jgi:hypothetical protein
MSKELRRKGGTTEKTPKLLDSLEIIPCDWNSSMPKELRRKRRNYRKNS